MIFKFEEWITDAEVNSYKLVGVEDDCGHLNYLPMFYAGYVDESDIEDSLGLEISKNKPDTYLSEFYSDSVPWENFTDDYVKYFPISKCPICGKKLEVKIVETVDKTDRIKELREKREKLRKKMKYTDSIRNMEKMKEEIREINEEIDDIHQDTGYGES